MSRGSRRTILISGTTSSSTIQRGVKSESIAPGNASLAEEGPTITGDFENGKSPIFNERLSS